MSADLLDLKQSSGFSVLLFWLSGIISTFTYLLILTNFAPKVIFDGFGFPILISP